MKILVIEDDINISNLLRKILNEFDLKFAYDGEEGLYLAKNFKFDLIILDWMLPKKDGMSILNQIKNQENLVLLLSAKNEIDSKVYALNLGADDYISKPFNIDELKARVKALLRRKLNNKDTVKYQDLEIDFFSKTIYKNNNKLSLSKKEYEVFEFLFKNKNQIFSADSIINNLWDNSFISSNVLQVIIYRLRQKLGKDIIKNKKNLGYYIQV